MPKKNLAPRQKPRPRKKTAEVVVEVPVFFLISLDDIKRINDLAVSKGFGDDLAVSKGFGDDLAALGISVEPLSD
jgi:hypothetical protein